jgi:chromosome partitioning protein
MILTVGNIKGGVGKTVLAVNIAAAMAQRGLDVLLIDGDEQASAAMFAQVRADAGAKPEFTTIQLQGAAIRQQARQLRDKYDEIVIDVGGRDTGSLRAALTITDAVLIPFQPRSVDLWAAGQIAALVAEAREVNGALKAYSVINIADPVGKDNEDAAAVLAGLEFIKPLPVTIVRRKAFPNAFSLGLGVGELVPRDQKAADELLSIVSLLYTQRADNDYQGALHRKAAV